MRIATTIGVMAISGVLAVITATSAAQFRQSKSLQRTGGSKTPTKDWTPPPLPNQVVEANRAVRLATYRGTNINPGREAEGQDLMIQRRLVARLAALDFKPQQRLDHFRWIERRKDVSVYGWRGIIKTMTRTATGIRLEVIVAPDLETGHANPTYTSDHVIESYFYDGVDLHFVGMEEPRDFVPGMGRE